MPVILQNNDYKLIFDRPEENYNGSRFDWTGKIVEVQFKGIPLTTTEKGDNLNIENTGKGLYNEFGIDLPLGYDDIPQGDYFHKIGIGKLLKEEDKYDFFKPYKIIPALFELEYSKTKISIKCISDDLNGYAYRLHKNIELTKTGFEIGYELENVGTKAIITNEYCHNFVAINNELIGSDYIVDFNFEIERENLEENVNPGNVVMLNDKKVSFNSGTNDQFFFTNFLHNKELSAQWSISNKKTGITIQEITDFKSKRFNLWGWKHVISPEIFININLQVANTIKWKRIYNIN